MALMTTVVRWLNGTGLKVVFCVGFITLALQASGQGWEWRLHRFQKEPPKDYHPVRKRLHNVLHFFPFGYARGDLSLHYQRRLVEFCAVQAGGGLSLRDPIFERFAARNPWHSANFSMKPSGTLRASVRWFPRTWPARTDFFIAQEYLFRNVRYGFVEELPQSDGSIGRSSSVVGYSIHSLRMLVGWQSLEVWRIHAEIFFGLAFNIASERYPRFMNEAHGPLYAYDRDVHFYPGFVAGLAVGYAF
jgi:hypothetical protein